jgi:hypothetical protein
MKGAGQRKPFAPKAASNMTRRLKTSHPLAGKCRSTIFFHSPPEKNACGYQCCFAQHYLFNALQIALFLPFRLLPPYRIPVAYLAA